MISVSPCLCGKKGFMALLEVNNISKRFGGLQAVKMVRALDRCLRDEPALCKQSIIDDPYTGGGTWYAAGGRGHTAGFPADRFELRHTKPMVTSRRPTRRRGR